METELPTGSDAARLTALETKIDKIYVSVEKTRKYFFWTMVLSVVLFVVPMIGLVFAIPFFMTNYVGGLNSMMQLTN